MKIIPGTTKLFNMTDELYFGDGLPDHISNSKMGLINPKEGGSVRKYQNGFEAKSDAFRLGSAVHQLVLERESYKLAEVKVPSDGPRKIINLVHKLTTREDNPLDFDEAIEMSITVNNYYKGNPGPKRTASLIESTKEYYDYLCDNGTEGLIFLDTALKEKCINALAAIDNNLDFEKLLNPKVDLAIANHDIESYNEYVMTCAIIHNGEKFHLKLKMDNFTVDHTAKKVTLNDLKTTSSRIDNFMGIETFGLKDFAFVPVKVEGSFQKYHYYRQMYMYSTILKQWVAETFGTDYDFECNMLVVETQGFKPQAAVFNVDEWWMAQGEKEFNYLMTLIFEMVHGVDGSSSELSEIDDDSHYTPEEDDLADLDEEELDDILD